SPGQLREIFSYPLGVPAWPLPPPSLLLRPHRVVARAAEGTQVRHVQPSLPCHAEWDDMVHRRRWRDSLVLQASLAQVVVPGQHGPPEPLPRGTLVERPRPLVPTVPVVVPVDNAPVLPPLLVGPGVGQAVHGRRPHQLRAPRGATWSHWSHRHHSRPANRPPRQGGGPRRPCGAAGGGCGRAKGGPAWDRPAGLLHLRPPAKVNPPPRATLWPGQRAKLSTRRARTCTSQLSEAQCRLLSVYCSATASPSGIPRTQYPPPRATLFRGNGKN